jgi:hypothetical protein
VKCLVSSKPSTPGTKKREFGLYGSITPKLSMITEKLVKKNEAPSIF